MKKTLLGMLMVLFLSACAFAGELDFTLINQTGFAIAKVFVSPTSQKEWGDDVMGSDMLENGGSVDIKFSPKEDEKVWDLKVIDKDGGEVYWTGIDLSKTEKVTLHYENNNPTATIE